MIGIWTTFFFKTNDNQIFEVKKTEYKKSALYLFLTIVAFALLGYGGYLIRSGAFLNVFFGFILAIIGFIIGAVLL